MSRVEKGGTKFKPILFRKKPQTQSISQKSNSTSLPAPSVNPFGSSQAPELVPQAASELASGLESIDDGPQIDSAPFSVSVLLNMISSTPAVPTVVAIDDERDEEIPPTRRAIPSIASSSQGRPIIIAPPRRNPAPTGGIPIMAPTNRRAEPAHIVDNHSSFRSTPVPIMIPSSRQPLLPPAAGQGEPTNPASDALRASQPVASTSNTSFTQEPASYASESGLSSHATSRRSKKGEKRKATDENTEQTGGEGERLTRKKRRVAVARPVKPAAARRTSPQQTLDGIEHGEGLGETAVGNGLVQITNTTASQRTVKKSGKGKYRAHQDGNYENEGENADGSSSSSSDSDTFNRLPPHNRNKGPRPRLDKAVTEYPDIGAPIDETTVTMLDLCNGVGNGRYSQRYLEIFKLDEENRKRKKEEMGRLRDDVRSRQLGLGDPSDGSAGLRNGRGLTAADLFGADVAAGQSRQKPLTITDGNDIGDNEVGEDEYNSNAVINRRAPQIRINAAGEMVVDESALDYDRHIEAEQDMAASGPLTVVVETEATAFSNFASFARKPTTQRWSKEETQIFYMALRKYHMNFDLIARVMPGRTRTMVKNKFNAEDKKNSALITRLLSAEMRIQLDTDELARMTGRDFSGPIPVVEEIPINPVLTLPEGDTNTGVHSDAETQRGRSSGGENTEDYGDIEYLLDEDEDQSTNKVKRGRKESKKPVKKSKSRSQSIAGLSASAASADIDSGRETRGASSSGNVESVGTSGRRRPAGGLLMIGGTSRLERATDGE